MPLFPIPQALEPSRRLEATLYAELSSLAQRPARDLRVTALAGDTGIRGEFLRWFLLEAVPSAHLPIAKVELAQAVCEGVLDLDACSLGFELSFVACQFNDPIQLADATLIGFELAGGAAPAILADRVTLKGSMLLHVRHGTTNTGPRIARLRLCGADIRGNFDLRGSVIGATPGAAQGQPPLFADGLNVQGNVLMGDGFTAQGEVRLNGSHIRRNLDCSGATLQNPGGYSLSAAGAHIQGSAYFCEPHPWDTAPVRRPFSSEGTLRLEGATIDGDLDCSGGQFAATAFLVGRTQDDDLAAISADGLNVGADLIFDANDTTGNNFQVRGEVGLISARVGGDFSCQGAVFSFPGEEPLSADGIVVEGTTFLDGIRTDGILRFVQANLRQGLYLNGSTFDTTRGCQNWTRNLQNVAALELGGPACGIYAPYAVVGATMWWSDVTKVANAGDLGNPFWLFIKGAKLANIEDDQRSWNALDRFELTDCEYDTFVNLRENESTWRLRTLDRQYARMNIDRRWPGLVLAGMRFARRLHRILPCAPAAGSDPVEDAVTAFKPQPYLQLARTFRAASYEVAARNVMVRLERNKTRYSDFGLPWQLWRHWLDGILRYGYSPFRPLLIVLLWACFSAVWFQRGYDAHVIVPARDNQVAVSTSAPSSASAQPRVPFNALIYAVDSLVPIVDLNQKKNWTLQTSPAPGSDPLGQAVGLQVAAERAWTSLPHSRISLLLIFNTVFGWLMTTLFAAGVSGLLRTKE